VPDSSRILKKLIEEFESGRKPISVNFRELVSWLPYNSPRYSHYVHTYPAKVIPHIPHFFLGCEDFFKAGSRILDPFSGSGTVALEACLAGHHAIVSDSNPLALLVTRVKTTPLSQAHLTNSISKLQQLVKQTRGAVPPEVVNIEYWYHAHTIKQLSRVAKAISKLESSPFKRLSQVALSTTARKISLVDPRISVPVRLNPDRYSEGHALKIKTALHLKNLESTDAIALYFRILKEVADQVASLWPLRKSLGKLENVYTNSLTSGSRSLSLHAASSVDGIVTSPPYLGAQKYIRSCSLSLGWLSITKPEKLRSIEDLSIGREHFAKKSYSEEPKKCLPAADALIKKVYHRNPLRAKIAASYLSEMKDVFKTCHKVLKKGAPMVLVSGCNMLNGEMFDTTAYLQQICIEIGFKPVVEMTDIIKSRGLMTLRNKTASVIPLESVTLFNKL